MPYFSVCISAYNCEQYLSACLDSVISQEFTDFEIVIVDDASTDGTARVIDEYAARDGRIKVIHKPVNEGLHLGHHSTVATAEGRYVLFLDADDEFESGLLSKLAVILTDDPAPMLHFGIRVVGENGVSQKASDDFAQFVNREVETLVGPDINDAVFGGCGEYRQDWRIPQRVYSSSLVKRAFCSMPACRLDCAEDAYEFFVISSMASRQITRNDVIGIVYHLGRGLNGASDWNAAKFSEVAASFEGCIKGIFDYAKQRNNAWLAKSAEKGAFKLYQLLFNDWLGRVPDSEKIDAALVSSEDLGASVVASEVMRCARDAAWESFPIDPASRSGSISLSSLAMRPSRNWRVTQAVKSRRAIISSSLQKPSAALISMNSRFEFSFPLIKTLRFLIARSFSPYKLDLHAQVIVSRGRFMMTRVRTFLI